MKHRKLLLSFLTVGLLSTMGVANAATETATQVLQCTLGSYVNITPDFEAVTSSTINPDNGNLLSSLISKFDIEVNSEQTLYLRANAESSTTNEKAFFKNGSDVFVVLAHKDLKPLVASINDAKTSNPTATNNPNVIAYKVTGVTLTGASESSTPNFNADTSQYEISAKPGKTVATTTIGTAVVPATYSYLDNAGTYQAVVTLTTAET